MRYSDQIWNVANLERFLSRYWKDAWRKKVTTHQSAKCHAAKSHDAAAFWANTWLSIQISQKMSFETYSLYNIYYKIRNLGHMNKTLE